jgi:hypothetical protein
VIVGKTVTTEFAATEPRGTRNPHDLRRTPGGSSSCSTTASRSAASYERHAPANADHAWFWSITEYVKPRSGLRTSGTASTLTKPRLRSGTLEPPARMGRADRVRSGVIGNSVLVVVDTSGGWCPT